ncbi:putative MFS transporter [Saccharata proteae CBS 121410]|uniref:Putative MFS transporter n=1 Tax=Saccharata proteae CBS 121410 TaxID=1314787 RepID=A0A6A5YEX8_9PEZI|nr:putative MFS transporter [Saccharata proteae CBS 121410]
MTLPQPKDVEAALHDQMNILPKARLIIVFVLLSLTLCVYCIDSTSIGQMLPSVAKDLRAQSTIGWAGISSLIANTVFQVLYGRLSDIFGRKLVYLSAIALLGVSALLSGFAVNSTMLYVARGLAGIAGGGISSLTQMIVSDVVSLERRGKYQGILGSMSGIGNLSGPVLGAVFAQRSAWRGLFFLLICPLSALCFAINWYVVPSVTPTADFRENVRKIDFYGTFTSAVAIIFLLYPICAGGSYLEWRSATAISMLTIGGVAAVAFIFIECKVARLPMLPPSLFKRLPTAVLLAQNFFYGIAYYTYLYYLPLYYQNVRNYTPLTSALLTIPLVLCQSLTSWLSGQYISRRNRYIEVLWFGFLVWTIGASLAAALFNRSIRPAAIIVIQCLVGLAIGCVLQTSLVAAQAHVSTSQRAVVISARNFLRSLGGAFGLAIAASVLQNVLQHSLPTEFKYLSDSSYATPDYSRYSHVDSERIRDAYAKASRSVFIMLAPVIGLCTIGCFFVRDVGLKKEDEEGGPLKAVLRELQTEAQTERMSPRASRTGSELRRLNRSSQDVP